MKMPRVTAIRHEVKLARRLTRLSELFNAPKLSQVELMSDDRFDAMCKQLEPKAERIKALKAQAEEAKTSMIHMHRRNLALEREIAGLKLQLTGLNGGEMTAKSEWVVVTSEEQMC